MTLPPHMLAAALGDWESDELPDISAGDQSMQMFAGPGSAPMLETAAAWDGLAVELGAAAQSFASVTSGLVSETWQGSAAAAMMTAATPYVGWLSAAAARAAGAAAQAQAVAGAFESARAATVHPALVEANRNQFVRLVVANIFGQNAPAIAAAECEYEQMWAADVAAVVGYHGGASAAAAELAALPKLLETLTSPQARVANAPASGPGNSAGSVLQRLEQAQIVHNTNLVNGELGFNQWLTVHEVASEQRIFGTNNALNGAINRAFNVGNLLLGFDEQFLNTIVGAPIPVSLTGSLLTGSGQIIFNGGQIGGLLGAFDQALMVPTDLAGLVTGNPSPAPPVLQQLEQG